MLYSGEARLCGPAPSSTHLPDYSVMSGTNILTRDTKPCNVSTPTRVNCVIIQNYKMCCFDFKPSPSFETAAQTCQCVFKSVIKLVLCQ